MLDTFLLTFETLLKDPTIGGSIILLTIALFSVFFSPFFNPLLKKFILLGFLLMTAFIYISASQSIDQKLVNYVSTFECTSASFDVNKKFKEYYIDNTLIMVEAKNIFLEYDNCLAENNSSFENWLEVLKWQRDNNLSLNNK